jgi:DNA-binding Lrp family transcriptional regulator
MKIKIRKRYLFFVLAFTSAIIYAINAGVDSIAGNLIENYWILSISCFILAFIVSFSCSAFLSIPLNRKSIGSRLLDPSFRHIRLIKKKEIFYQIISGLGNSAMTIGYFALFYDKNLGSSPAVILPFSQIVIIYLLIAESITEKNTPTLIDIQSSVIVTFGAILGSISLTGTISISALVIVFLVINPGSMLFSFYQRKLKMMKINEKPNDAINIRLWNVAFALFFTLLITLIFDLYYNTSNIIEGFIASIQFFNWMFLMAFGTFFSFVLYIRALGIGKASVAQAVKSSAIIFSIPVTLVLSSFGLADSFPTNPVLLFIKIIGIIILMLGISTFALTLTKAYIFIKMKPGFPIENTMKRLWSIKGVNRVAALAGSYDFIIKIHTRTLVKGYERIFRKVQEIPGIKEYRWQSVLKEWEDI